MSIMEAMGRKRPRSRRSFTPELKAEIVELRGRGDRSVGRVAKDFDLTETSRGRKPASAGPSAREIREWAKNRGIQVNERGRIFVRRNGHQFDDSQTS
jgi:hypothetical protein